MMDAGARKRSTNVEEQEQKGRSQEKIHAEHQGPGTGARRKEPRKVLHGTSTLKNRSTKEGTKEGCLRSTKAGGTNKHQKKKPAHTCSKGDSQK
jgi:hypothetical protein